MNGSQLESHSVSGFAGGSPTDQRHATWLELFYDLVYVVAVANLAGQLGRNVSLEGLAVFAGLFLPVWWSWAGHTIFATRFGRDDNLERGLTLLQMLAAAAMAMQLPGALGAGSAGFAGTYVATRATLLVLYLRARGHYPEARNLNTVLVAGYAFGAGLWLVSLAFPTPMRFVLWVVGICVEFGTFLLARNVSRRFPVHTSHLPERFGLFTIIVLGEAILAIVLGVADVNWNPLAIGAALAGFAMAASIWWNYFGYVDRAPIQCTLGNGQAYMFFHLPMLLGLIATGVGIEHVITESGQSEFLPETLWLLAGGLVVWVVSFFGLQSVTYPPRERRRLATTYGLASLGILATVLVGAPFHPVGVITILSLVMGVVALLEVQRRAAVLPRAYVSQDQPSRPSTTHESREYLGEGIVVMFNPHVCIHSAECLTRLPKVFDLRNRPWVKPDNATVETVSHAIAACPSGALTYRLLKDEKAES